MADKQHYRNAAFMWALASCPHSWKSQGFTLERPNFITDEKRYIKSEQIAQPNYIAFSTYIDALPDDDRGDGHLGALRLGPRIPRPLLVLCKPLLLPPETHYPRRQLL
jgi:hypothetical protein